MLLNISTHCAKVENYLINSHQQPKYINVTLNMFIPFRAQVQIESTTTLKWKIIKLCNQEVQGYYSLDVALYQAVNILHCQNQNLKNEMSLMF